MHGNLSYVVLYTQCLRYNICSAWFLDIRISTYFMSILLLGTNVPNDILYIRIG